MKKIKIGIPRALLYYRYGMLWKTFLEALGCKVMISPETNEEILKLGITNTSRNSCISSKIFIGHVIYLAPLCDYILTPKICNYGKNEKVCPIINKNYKKIKEYIPKDKILTYEIEHTKYRYEIIGLIKIGLKFTKNIIKILNSYLYAKSKEKEYNLSKNNENINKLSQNKKKILIVSQFYNIQEKILGKKIEEYLLSEKIAPILSNNIDYKTAIFFSEYFEDNVDWKYSKEMIGALYFYKYRVDGIIFISDENCKIDNYINKELMLKNKEIPILNIIIGENINELLIKQELKEFIYNIIWYNINPTWHNII